MGAVEAWFHPFSSAVSAKFKWSVSIHSCFTPVEGALVPVGYKGGRAPELVWIFFFEKTEISNPCWKKLGSEAHNDF
jgi:hypothetical protein